MITETYIKDGLLPQYTISPDEWTKQVHKGLSAKLWSRDVEYNITQLSDKFYISSNSIYIYILGSNRRFTDEELLADSITDSNHVFGNDPQGGVHEFFFYIYRPFCWFVFITLN